MDGQPIDKELNPERRGIYTSEVQISVVAQIVAMLVAAGYLRQDESELWVIIIILVLTYLPSLNVTISRTLIKLRTLNQK